MNIRLLKHLGAVAALAGAMLTTSVANASILTGSQVQFVGTAIVNLAGDVTPRDAFVPAVVPPPPVNVQIAVNGNLGSFAGYNTPNPGPNMPYVANWDKLTSAGPFPLVNFIALPAVSAPDSPTVQATFFDLNNWQFQFLPFGNATFFIGTGVGVIHDGLGNKLSDAIFSFSTQRFQPGDNSFSATLEATVIPVPGAIWIFGSGLLLMTAVMRRKVK